MKNTGIEYLSTERKPHVLNELATLLPPLSEEQRSSLEADLLTNGCYSPIVVNEDMAIVDGHNRQQICEEHDIPYRMRKTMVGLDLSSGKVEDRLQDLDLFAQKLNPCSRRKVKTWKN